MDQRKARPAAAGRGDESGRSRTWTSGLSVNEFACLRTAGFEPVGQVMGASVHTLDPQSMIMFQERGQWRMTGSSPQGYAAHDVIYAARRAAMRDMAAECHALGGDGIIAVRVEIGPFKDEVGTLAFRVDGTAVRARGAVRPPQPFSSHLSAQEFTKLIDAGWVPIQLVLGMSAGRLYDTANVRRQTRRLARNQEVWQWNNTVAFIRRRARIMLENDAAEVGADGVVVSGFGFEVHEFNGERFVEARFIGTAIAAFGSRRRRPRHKRSFLTSMLSALRTPSPGAEPKGPPPARTESIMRLSTDDPDRS